MILNIHIDVANIKYSDVGHHLPICNDSEYFDNFEYWVFWCLVFWYWSLFDGDGCEYLMLANVAELHTGNAHTKKKVKVITVKLKSK